MKLLSALLLSAVVFVSVDFYGKKREAILKMQSETTA
jgi:hypothetical protein